MEYDKQIYINRFGAKKVGNLLVKDHKYKKS